MFQRHAATKAKTVSSAATPSGPEAGAVAPAALSVVYTTGSQLATSSSTSSSSSSSLQAVSFFLTSDALSLLRVGATSTEKGDSGGTTVETILGGAECALFDGAAAFAPASFQDFKADAGECLWLYPTAAATSKGAAKNKTYPRILLVGLGRATSVTLASYRSASYKAISSFQALLLTRVGLILPAPPLEQQQRFFDSHYQGEVVGNVARVATLSEHYFRKYLSQKTIEAKKRKPIERIEIIDLQQRVAAGSSSKSKASAASSASMSDHSRIVSTHTAIARATLRARDWANERGDVANTEWMERQARSVAKAGKLKITVLQDAELEKEGLHLIRAVGQAATHKARLVLLEYHGHSDSKAPPIALVGKGITFDTGGLLIKPRGGMEGMHIDKAGSAAVLGVMSAVSELGLKENIVGVLALAENAISHAAYKPLAILPSAAGSVEVSDTDAEGRLVLADALTYVQRTYRPDRIIDIATLTGAAGQ
jgi:leucyl aminopeptidase